MYFKTIATYLLIAYGFCSYAQFDTDLKYAPFFGNSNSKEITSYLAKADAFIANDKYDSAQFWLNRVFAAKNSYSISIQNCYSLSRQAEILYYNNIHLMGEETSRRELDMALALNDSLLIADGYNFIGLFLSNMDSTEEAISYFKKAIPYFKKAPAGSFYEKLTRPLHTFGDIAETFDKMNKPDSAIHYASISFRKAVEINRLRGQAVALQIIAKSYDKKGMPDSSKKYYGKSIDIASLANENDVVLVGKAGLAKSYLDQRDISKANQLVDSGMFFLNTHPEINILYAKYFFAQVLKIYKISASNNEIRTVENKIIFLDSLINRKQASQMQAVFKNLALVENQLLNTEINELKQKNRVRISVLFLVVILLVSIFIVNQILRQRKIQSTNAVHKERERIVTDLHDDIGATLSSMHIYSDLAKNVWDVQPEESKKMIEKISVTSKDLMYRMGDIIWSMKPAGEEKYTLEVRLKNYSNELLAPKNIIVMFDIDEKLAVSITNPEARKNILLIAKETMNNIAKYSGASKAILLLEKLKTEVKLTISDNGKGFDINVTNLGNGIKNIKSRCALLKGNCVIKSEPGKGVTITCRFPIAIISHAG